MVYTAAYPALADLIQFLMRDCCQGHRKSVPPPLPRSLPAALQPETPSVYDPIDVVIYHNPGCGTSRNTLAMIRNAGIEPHVVEYLKTPSEPDVDQAAPGPG